MKKLFIIIVASIMATAFACSPSSEKKEVRREQSEVNVYTHRHYEIDQQLFRNFTEQTGIKVNVVSASADELIKKLELEGKNSPADILITVDAGRLHRAKEMDLLQTVNSDKINSNVPAKFRDKDNQWFGLTYRARVIAINPEKINESEISNYEDLAYSKWKGQVLMRSSENIYNQSLLASLIANDGEEAAKKWAEAVKENFARSPKGNDRDQVKAIAAGLGDITVVNSYYLGHMLNSSDEQEKNAVNAVKIIFPNQDGRGTHINVSGAAVTKHAPNKENAIKFIEFLSSEEAQKLFAGSNYEYPVKDGIEWAETLRAWGQFKSDDLAFEELGKNNREAVIIFDAVNWK